MVVFCMIMVSAKFEMYLVSGLSLLQYIKYVNITASNASVIIVRDQAEITRDIMCISTI